MSLSKLRLREREREGLERFSWLSIRAVTRLVKMVNKAVPLQAWSGPEGSRMLWFPDFMTTAQDGGKVCEDGKCTLEFRN